MEAHQAVFFFVLWILRACALDVDDSANVVVRDRKIIMATSTVTSTAAPASNKTISRRVLAWNHLVRNATKEAKVASGSMGPKSRALPAFNTPLDETSSETNVPSKQAGNLRAHHNEVREFSEDLVPQNSPYPQGDARRTGNCRCEAYADCRDVSAFARMGRDRADFCPAGKVLCCADRRPSAVGGQPIPIVIPGDSVVVGSPVPSGGLPSNQGCGIKGGNPLARTIDATNPRGESEFGEYPWMTAVLKSDLSYVCGGALVDARIVLTAAHCVSKVKNEDLIVRLGEYDVSETSEPPYQDVHVRRVVIHADYHSGTLRNDIALLILEKPVQMTGYIRPVCLPPVQDLTGLVCTVTGWGKNRPDGQYSNILKEVDVPIMDNAQCQTALRSAPELGPVFNLQKSFVCAGVPGKDACAGDGGSPLVCRVDGVYRLVGLVSWGIGCGQYPGVYAKVADFLPWIMGVLKENP